MTLIWGSRGDVVLILHRSKQYLGKTADLFHGPLIWKADVNHIYACTGRFKVLFLYIVIEF